MSDEPVRLRDDPDAPEWVRAAFERAARTPVVTPDAAAGLARFDAARAAEGAGAAAQGGLARRLARARGWWGLGAVGVASVAAWLALRGGLPRRSAAAPATHAAVRTEVRARVTAAVDPPTPAQPVSGAPSDVDAAPAPLAHPPPVAPSRDGAHERHAAAPTGDALRREFDNLAQVRAALPTDPARALALATAGHRAFPRGAVAEEREALAIVALARLGRVDAARARARAFLARHPRGIYAEQVRRVGTEEPRPADDARRFR